MGHYGWIYEEHTCAKCKKEKLDGLEAKRINEHYIKSNSNFENYKGQSLCKDCIEELKHQK